MKFLMVAVAIMSVHSAWGAFPEGALPNPALGKSAHEVQQHNPNPLDSLGKSLQSPEVAGEDDDLARSIESH